MKTFRFFLTLAALWILPAAVSSAEETSQCYDIQQPGGATARYCIPKLWNGYLVVYAHGTVAASDPLGFYHLELSDDINLPDLVTALGYAFATTTFRTNGLNTLEGVEDLKNLVAGFPSVFGVAPKRVVLAAVSLGCSPAALALERYPNLFNSALLLSGPIGSMGLQLDYLLNFRVLYDYYFPEVLPGSATNVPPELMANWYTAYEASVEQAALNDPERTFELLRVAMVAHAPGDAQAAAKICSELLWYHVFELDDVRTRLGGIPFDNRKVRYRGSSDDTALNQFVTRINGDNAAQLKMFEYENRARPAQPIVIMHNTGDDVVPYWQATLYQWRAQRNGRGKWVTVMPINRTGHVNMTVPELLNGFFTAAEAGGAGLALPRR